jgi:hypothetical protein
MSGKSYLFHVLKSDFEKNYRPKLKIGLRAIVVEN